MESMVVFGIGLAAFYWICESFMYFFMKPEANFIQHLFGPGKFEIFTQLLVFQSLANILCKIKFGAICH